MAHYRLPGLLGQATSVALARVVTDRGGQRESAPGAVIVAAGEARRGLARNQACERDYSA